MVSENAAENVTLTFYGMHVLTLQNTCPNNSDWIKWDGKKIDQALLVRLLRIEVNPFDLGPLTTPLSWRFRHALADLQETECTA